MDYIGSKTKLLNWIFDEIIEVVPPSLNCIFLDACSGSGVVSKYAAKLGYFVISNDIMQFPKVITNGSIGLTNDQQTIAFDHITIINNLKRKQSDTGFFHSNFSLGGSHRKYVNGWTARSIDKVRKYIEEEESNEKIKDYLLYCGIEALSKISNTAGVQAAYLKKFKERAKDKFVLKCEPITNGSIVAYSKDILDLLLDSDFRNKYTETILYIDPPYNQRQYGPNYHLYETFVRYDNPELVGITGIRKKWKEECGSKFCTKKECLSFLTDIIKSTRAKYVFLSYSSDGLLKKEDIFREYPNAILKEQSQRRYKSDVSIKRTYNTDELKEYLFQIQPP